MSAMRFVFLLVLSTCVAACSRNPVVILTPHEPPAPLLGLPVTIDLEVTVRDPSGRLIDGAQVILLAQPDNREIKTLTGGMVKFYGVFIVPPRFFIVCASGFVCSDWTDMKEALGTGRMRETVVLRREAVPPKAAPITAAGAPRSPTQLSAGQRADDHERLLAAAKLP